MCNFKEEWFLSLQMIFKSLRHNPRKQSWSQMIFFDVPFLKVSLCIIFKTRYLLLHIFSNFDLIFFFGEYKITSVNSQHEKTNSHTHKKKSDSDLVWRIQLISLRLKIPTHTTGIFNLRWLLIAFDKPNLSLKYILGIK